MKNSSSNVSKALIFSILTMSLGLSLSVNAPLFRYIGIFGDAALYSNQNFAWDYGFYLEFIPDFVEVYFPIQSNFVTQISQPNYYKQIRFVLNLELDAILNRVRRGYY
jgi:hypothetical protein